MSTENRNDTTRTNPNTIDTPEIIAVYNDDESPMTLLEAGADEPNMTYWITSDVWIDMETGEGQGGGWP